MKKLSFSLMLVLLVSAILSAHADASPNIRGEYSGAYTSVVSNCTDSSSNGAYIAVLEMNIPTQSGNTFSGTATGTFNIDGFTPVEYIQLSGIITETGQISGNTTHTFLSTSGEGTFTGQLSGDSLSIVNPGSDTSGDTCTYIRNMSATRAGISKGDIDDSGQVELLDAILALQINTGNSPSVPIYSGADINDDGRLGQAEAIYALQSTAGIRHETIKIDIAAYANFNSRWEYQNTEPDYATPSVEVIGTDTKNGKAVYVLQEYDPQGSPNDKSYYLSDMTNGLYSLGGVNNYQTPDEYEFFWEPEMPYLLASFIPGEESAFQSISSYDNAIVNGTISIEKEVVIVPAGTYTDCYKVTLSGSYNSENFTFYRWYAKNVGLVKRIGFGGGTWELETYTHDGFTYAELSENVFQLTDVEYPTCVFDLTFDNNSQFEAYGETINYTINNGCIKWNGNSSDVTSELCVQSRNGVQITAKFVMTGNSFEDRTDLWGADFSSLNNDATALKDWFIANGWWPGSAILADGRVTNQDASIDGIWWIDENVLYIDYPEADGCVDKKAYKLVNDRLMFATDADNTSTYTVIKK